MKRIITMLAMMVAFSLMTTAQDGGVGVQSTQSNSSVNFTVYNSTGSTVCVFPFVESSFNVYGAVVPMIQLNAGESNVNIGGFNQSDSSQAWSVNVGAKYRTGTCA